MALLIDLVFGAIPLALVVFAYAQLPDSMPIAAGTHIALLVTLWLHLRLVSLRLQGSFMDASIISFLYLFTIVAPCVQMLSLGTRMVNTGVITNEHAVAANLMFFCFALSYLYTRFHSLRNGQAVKPGHYYAAPSDDDHGSNSIALALGLGVLALATGLVSYVTATAIFEDAAYSQVVAAIDPIDLILKKFLYFMPVPIVLYLATARRRSIFGNPLWALVALISVIGLLLSQNPLVEKRNSLGPVYFSLIATLAITKIPRGATIFLLVFGVTTVFLPLTSMLTHAGIFEWFGGESKFVDVFIDHFFATHYDAWANAVAASEMVAHNGLTWGRQMIGAALFFVPRDIWPDKPLPTGMVIGDFLADYYSMWFRNLSAPFPMETFVDFWYFGCVAGGVLLGKFADLIDKMVWFGGVFARCTAIYFSFYMIFFMRGSLLVAIAYLLGNMAAFIFVRYFVYLIAPGSGNAAAARRVSAHASV